MSSITKGIGASVAVTHHKYNGFVYFFHADGTYSRLDRVNGAEVANQPMSGWSGWPGDWDCPHSVVSWDNEYLYFLRADEYIAYNLDKDVFEGGKQRLHEGFRGWPERWAGRVDAALYWGFHEWENDKKSFFFRDDLRANAVDPHFPKKTAREWPGWPSRWGQVWSAIDWGNGKTYFFSKDEYLRFDRYANRVDPDYPRSAHRFFEEQEAKLADENRELLFESQIPADERAHFAAQVRSIADSIGIRPDWLMASMWMESGFDPAAGRARDTNYTGLHQMSTGLVYAHWGRAALPALRPDLFQGQLLTDRDFAKDAVRRRAAEDEFARLHRTDQLGVVGRWLTGSMRSMRWKCRAFEQLRLIGFGGAGLAEPDSRMLSSVIPNNNPEYNPRWDHKIPYTGRHRCRGVQVRPVLDTAQQVQGRLQSRQPGAEPPGVATWCTTRYVQSTPSDPCVTGHKALWKSGSNWY